MTDVKAEIDARAEKKCACGHGVVMHDRFGKGGCERCSCTEANYTSLQVRRTQDEIVARVKEVKDGGGDVFGAEQMDLIEQLDFDHAKEWLNEGTTQVDWDANREETAAPTRAVAYVPFALDKIRDHRGLSAMRAVNHFRAWAWLLLDDQQFQEFEDTEYENYGAPKVKKFCELIGRADLWPTGEKELERMAAGSACGNDCGGCGH